MVQPDPVAAAPAPADLAELAELFRGGRHQELEQVAERLLQLHPAHGFLWKALGVARAALGKHEEALAAKARARAAGRAADLGALAQLRAGLREQVRATPLFDAKRFARSFTDALSGMAHAPS